jgi:transketolase
LNRLEKSISASDPPHMPADRKIHNDMANAIRALAMDSVEKAASGHPGLPMGFADVATVLVTRFLKFDAGDPRWPDRDRLVLSAGHGSMLLYALLYLTGYEDMTLAELKRFRQLGSKTAGHPEHGHAAGIETTTGPLGQGVGNSVGMAIAERHLAAEFGPDLVDHRTYVIAGDGCLMEGISQEAITLAGHLKLSKLTLFWDNNGITIDGKLSLADSTDQLKRFEAAGWAVTKLDGHDPDAISSAIQWAREQDRPSFIACRTIIGFGAPTKQGTAATHGSPLGKDEVAAARRELGWPYEAFAIPSDILERWRETGRRGSAQRREWQSRLKAADAGRRAEFERRLQGRLPDNFSKLLQSYKQELAKSPPSLATRNASQNALEVINPALPELIGGSADLTGSNNTKTKALEPFTADNPRGRYIYYGIREHAMAAAMNGMALHGGVIPYGGSFLAFTDYCRPALRLSALMCQRVVYVMTHDSIGLGEDGPTHQPVEHLAALRAIPGLRVLRPCDAVETAECWEIALKSEGPSVLALTRQKLKALRVNFDPKNWSAKGAYEIAAAARKPKAVIFASGSEVEIAVAAKERLDQYGLPARVVSVPSMELFFAQPQAYRRAILGVEKIRIAIEAAVRQGWGPFIGQDGIFIGMHGFGASAPYEDLYRHFGITPEAVLKAVKKRLR